MLTPILPLVCHLHNTTINKQYNQHSECNTHILSNHFHLPSPVFAELFHYLQIKNNNNHDVKCHRPTEQQRVDRYNNDTLKSTSTCSQKKRMRIVTEER